MRIASKKLSQRIINASFAFILALSTATASLPFIGSDNANALPFTTYRLKPSAAVINAEAGTGVGSLYTFVEWKSFIGGWNDFQASLGSAAITATATGGAEVSKDSTNWSSSETVETSKSVWNKVEGSFYLKSDTVGTFPINLSATINTTEGERVLNETINLVTSDTTAPGQATNPSPTNGSVLNMDTLRGMGFSWTAPSDASPITFEYGVTKAENKDVLWPAGDPSEGGYVWTIPNYNGSGRAGSSTPVPGNDLDDGEYYWKVRYTDASGNVGPWSDAWKFTIDSSAPTITWQQQPLSIYGKGQGFHVRPITNEVGTNKSVYIDSVDPSNLCYNKDSDHKNMDTKNTHCQALFDSLSDGTHKFVAVFTDRAGNTTTSSSNSFVVDRTEPIVKVEINRNYTDNKTGTYINDGASVNSAQKPEIEATDTNLSKIEITKADGTPVTSWTNVVPGKNYKGLSWLSEGTYKIYAYDAAGNKSDAFTLTIDNTAPSAPQFTSPTNYQWFNTKPTNKWDAVSDPSGIDYYQLKYIYDDGHTFDGTLCDGVKACREVPGNQTSRLHNLGADEEGLVRVWIRAVDNAGNVSPWSTPVYYYYDHTAPVINVSNIHDGDVINTGSDNKLVIEGEFTDNMRANYANIQLVRTGYAPLKTIYGQHPAGSTLATFDNVVPGHYTLTLTATDLSHHVVKKQISFTVDNTATVTGDYFAAKAGGLNVGFHVTNLNNNADKVEVALYDADDNLITTNVGDSAQMLALLNTNPADVSSPFWMPSQGATDGWWTFGNPDWKSVSKPSYAVVTVYYNGSEKAVSGHIPFSSPSDTGETWESLLAMLPADQSNGENNQSRDDNNSQGEGNNEQNQGEGAGDQNQSGQGDEAGQSEESQGSSDDVTEGEDVKGTQTTSEPEVKGVSDSNVWTLAGLAWYWWLLVLAILAFIGGLIAALRRRNQENA